MDTELFPTALEMAHYDALCAVVDYSLFPTTYYLVLRSECKKEGLL
jgi:hypothetical protein